MKNILRRIGWASLAILFVVTALGVGVVAFWQSTHQKDNQAAQQSANCQFDTPTASTLPLPEPYKPNGDVTQLAVTDIEQGTGDTIKPGDCITVKYYGTVAEDGKVFDENFDKSEALKFQYGAGVVIPGWEQGLKDMKVGATKRLVIPSDLAYGTEGACQTPNTQDPTKCDVYSIKPNADLVFVVKLLANK